MKKYSFLLFLFLLKLQLFSQNEYFQQEVNYKIDVQLNDQLHELNGNLSIEYKNNAPEALSFLYFHLWPNAYKNKKTAYAKQALQMDDPNFYFSTPDASGSISQLDFNVNGEKINWEFDKSNIDIAKLNLNQNLKSGESITINTPFKIKIPQNFSRLGHDGQSYQITQWYPKPAVFDKNGWHQMPYLDSGEFYSEFGNFDIKITLPANYVVGATGSLQNESEQKFLQEKIEATNQLIQNGFSDDMSFPSSSIESKTIHYIAEQVHDFAWFADKRFHVQKAEVLLSNGSKVETWAMFTNLEADIWKDATKYLNRAVQFYSDHIGTYPYPQATAVESALFAGGAMEYPMITVVASVDGDAQALDRYITHEIGHNWFYGILASNERDHPWMDEGLNSYYENRYMDTFYAQPEEDLLTERMKKFLGGAEKINPSKLFYQYQARSNLDQAPETHSLDLTAINYGLSAYAKPALSLKMLAEYVGQKSFDKAMKQYYQQWNYKHPQPADYQSLMEKSIGKKLDWLFDGFLFSTKKMDYKLKKVKNENELLLTIKNKGEINAPFPVSGISDGKIVKTKWYDGFAGEQTIAFPKANYDRISIDESQVTLDIYPKNNNYKLSAAIPKFEPLKLKILAGVETPNRSTLYWLPLISWNKYDQAMLGTAFYNTIVPANKFEFIVAPMYAVGSKSLTGLAKLKYNILPKKTFQKITIGASWKSFNFNYNQGLEYFSKYQRIVPSLSFEFKKPATSNVKQKINLRGIILFEDVANFDTIGNYTGNKVEQSTIYEINYRLEKYSAINPFRLDLNLEQQNYMSPFGRKESYLKASLEWNRSYTYNEEKNIDFRFFAGFFFNNTRRKAGNVSNRSTRASYTLAAQGFTDYKYDDFYFGRNEPEGIWSRQVIMKDGGFKNAFGNSFKIGQSNDFIIAINLKADLPKDLPLNLPLKPYFDIGYFSNAQPIGANDTFKDQLLWSGGVSFELGRNLFRGAVFAIYFPLLNSDNIKELYKATDDGKYFSRLSFMLDLNRANPWDLINNWKF